MRQVPPWPVRTAVVAACGVAVAASVVTALAWLLARTFDIPFFELSRDPASIAELPAHTGAYANITIVVWQVGATAGLAGAALRRALGLRDRMTALLLCGGLLSAVMGADDFFQLHESATAAGLPEQVPPAVYAAAAVTICVVFRRQLGPGLLVAGTALFGWSASAGMDVVLHLSAPLVVEDGLKLVGATAWAVLMLGTARRSLVADWVGRVDAPAPPDHPAPDVDGRAVVPAPRPHHSGPTPAVADDSATSPLPVRGRPRRAPLADGQAIVESATIATHGRPQRRPGRRTGTPVGGADGPGTVGSGRHRGGVAADSGARRATGSGAHQGGRGEATNVLPSVVARRPRHGVPDDL